MTLTEVYARIRNAVTLAGSQKAFAEQANVSPQYVCDVMNGRLDPGKAILSAVGVRRKVVYEIVGEDK